MAQFKDLPNEIVIMIAENVLPGDIVNFSATSKNIQRLSEPFLRKDREMKHKYRKYSCIRKIRPMLNLLYDIILQPSVALYVKCLTIENWYEYWDDDKPKPSHTRYPQEKMTSLKKAAAGSVPSDQVSSWVSAIERGDEDPLLALLLLQLSQVTTFKLKRIGITCQCLFQTLTRILGTPGAPHLSNLTTLEINSHTLGPNDWYDDWWAINVFAALPSLRSIKAWNIRVEEDYDDSDDCLHPRSSNVSSLFFTRMSISVQRLVKFLQGFKDLKRFSYTYTYRSEDPFDTFWIRAALLAHAKASLEYLCLNRMYADKKGYMGSLREFESLKEIQTDLDFLVDAPRPGRVVLAQMLPASIEEVHLYKDLYDDPESFRELITTTAKDKPKLLPRLKQLHFRFYIDDIDVEGEPMMIAEMEETCRDVGFELIMD